MNDCLYRRNNTLHSMKKWIKQKYTRKWSSKEKRQDRSYLPLHCIYFDTHHRSPNIHMHYPCRHQSIHRHLICLSGKIFTKRSKLSNFRLFFNFNTGINRQSLKPLCVPSPSNAIVYIITITSILPPVIINHILFSSSSSVPVRSSNGEYMVHMVAIVMIETKFFNYR